MEETTTQPQQVVNPLLDRLRIPGETFRLPSQGLFYTDGELDPSVRNGEVEVYPMTAMDEIILSTPDKLLSGKAVAEVFQRCVPTILKPEKLLSKDVDYLMACLRLVSFGPSMTVSYQHSCDNSKSHEYTVDIQNVIKRAKQIDPTSVKTDYQLAMPNGQKVTMRPLTYDGVMKLYQTTAMMKTDSVSDEEARILIIGTLTNIIKNVDGETNAKMIEEWVTQIPLGWKRMIEQSAQKTNTWGIDFKVESQCKDCKEKIQLEVTANPVSFFS